MLLVDHLFVIALATLLPWYSWRYQRALAARIRQGEQPDRRRLYLQTSLEHWCALFALALLWFLEERSLTALGLVTPGGGGFWSGAAFATAFVLYLVLAWRKVRQMTAAEKNTQVAGMGEFAALLPHNKRELKAFAVLSVTAGIVEEIVYRGYLFWFFLPLLPPWAVVIVTSLFFGLGHIYQGGGNALRITGIGIAIGALYLVTGSIWVPIALHILGDILQGAITFELLRDAHKSKESDAAVT